MPAKRGRAPQGGEFQQVLVAQAVKVLDDPRVRAEICEQGGKIVDAAQEWFSKKSNEGGPSISDRIGRHFGQKGLEGRASNLRAAVADVSRNSDALADSLRPVHGALDEVDQMLTVAKALPFTKRKRAHLRIDDVLDGLESGLFDATLRGAPDAEA
jgi:hypothetical protein